MAKIEQLEPRMSLRDQLPGASENVLRRSVMPSIRWGAVIAGLAVGLSVHLVLVLFGLATGLAAFTADGRNDLQDIPVIWAVIGMLAAVFAGGFVAGRMSGLKRKTDGILHGAVTWAVMTLALAALAGQAGGTLLEVPLGGVAPEVVRETRDEGYGLTVILRGMIGGDASVPDMQTLERYIRSGQREEATLLLSAMGMDPVRAATVADQAMIAAANQLEASPRRPAAGMSGATRPTDAVAWLVFVGVFLSLLSGMGGGLLGSLSAQRLVWIKPAAVSEKGAATPSP